MAFSVKDWRNANAVGGGGDTSTPLDAPALEDMETRLSGYTDTRVVREAGLNPEDYGAVGDAASATADTAGFAAAIAALATVSGRKTGKINLPANRWYKINSGGLLNLDDAAGVEIEGVGGMSNLAGRPMIEWLGAASSGPLIRAASGTVTLRNLALVYSNAAYDGDLVKLGRSALATDAFYPHFERCYFAGISGAILARSLLNVNSGIGGKVKGCQFIDAVTGLRGSDGNFTTAWTVDDGNFFNRCSTAGIYNPSEGWMIAKNAFEPKADGGPCGIRGDAADAGTTVPVGVSVVSNWFGDVTGGAAGSWIDLRGRGIDIIGNRLHMEVNASSGEHTAIMLRNALGTLIAGNNFSSAGSSRTVNFQQFSGALCDAVELVGNRLTSVLAPTNDTTNCTSGEYRNNVGLTDKKWGRATALASYTVATRPTASSFTGQLIYVSDAAANNKLQYSDGAAWVAAG